MSQALYDAVVAAQTKVVRDELAGGADPNAPAQCGDKRCGREHFPINAVLSGLYEGGKRRTRAVELAKVLLDAGADPNIAAFAEESLHLGGPLARAVRRDHAELVELLLRRGAIVFDAKDHDPERTSVMHLAAEHASVEVCKMLLERGGDAALGAFDFVHRTPLAVAIERVSLPHVELFLDAGADPNLADDESHGDPPLRYAIKARDLEIVRCLVAAGADPDVVGWFGHTPRTDVENGDDFAKAVRALFGRRK